MTKRMIIYGNMPYTELKSVENPDFSQLTYWDLWIAVILVKKCDKDWDKLLDHLRNQIKAIHYHRSNGEALMSHIRFLRWMLDEEGLLVEAIFADADYELLKKAEQKAMKKVWKLDFQDKEKTQWMLQTPRVIREARAMRGYWDRFPVNPLKYATEWEKKYKKSGYYTEDQSFALEEKLSGFFAKLPARISLAENFAAHRAFLSVVIEKMEMVDDSYGVIGGLYQDLFTSYIQLDRTELDMCPEDFLQDILELMLWEDYGLTDACKAEFFSALLPAEASIVKSVLEQQKAELDELELDYQAKNAAGMMKKYGLRAG